MNCCGMNFWGDACLRRRCVHHTIRTIQNAKCRAPAIAKQANDALSSEQAMQLAVTRTPAMIRKMIQEIRRPIHHHFDIGLPGEEAARTTT